MADILVIGGDLVRRLLPMGRCIGLMEQAFRAASDGSSVQTPRGITKLPGADAGLLGVMPGGMTTPPRFGVKVISVRHGHGHQSHQGGVLLFDNADYAPVALVHAGEITAIRTAAATAVATRALARPDAEVLAILGTGEQAETHLQALSIERRWSDIRIWGRDGEKAASLARHFAKLPCPPRAVASVRDAVAGADVVCTVSASPTPILTADMLAPGMHLNLVGASTAASREVDSGTVAASRLFVDNLAMARGAGGEIITALAEGAISDAHILGEMGQVLLGKIPGRQGDTDITVFKSLGMPVEDLVAVDFIYNEARRLGLGTRCPF